MADPTPTWYLREWLQYLGLKPQWLADKTGLDKSQISRLIKGEYSWNTHHRRRFAEALGIEPWWLSDVNPFDPGSDLKLLQAIRAVPAEQRPFVERILTGLAADEPAAGEAPAPAAAKPAPKRRAKKRR